MSNPFTDITDPATLRAMVQDGVKCERCEGKGEYSHWWAMDELGTKDCESCATTGHTPLSNADLDALAACWCEGGWLQWDPQWDPHKGLWTIWDSYYSWWSISEIPAYTTSPDAAMRLQVEYELYMPRSTLISTPGGYLVPLADRTVEELCHAITTAALVAALTEAIKGVL